MAVTSAARPQQSTRFIFRSYLAFVLAPEPPIVEWLADIDRQVRDAGSFFAGRPVVLDLAAVSLSAFAVAHLIGELEKRGIRVMGIENAEQEQIGSNLPPLLRSSRAASVEADVAAPPPQNGRDPDAPATLLLEEPIRSGQSVIFPHGDVTVLGSVGSGAELVAGGSIHIYGTLRGRAMAGANGNSRARIFCSRIEAELMAINGFYWTADSIDPGVAQSSCPGMARRQCAENRGA